MASAETQGGCGGGGDEVGKFLHTFIRGGIEETNKEKQNRNEAKK